MKTEEERNEKQVNYSTDPQAQGYIERGSEPIIKGASLNKAEDKERAWLESENIRVLKEIEREFSLFC